MNGVPDENDIVYDQYGFDIVGLIRYVYEKMFGGDWQSGFDTLTVIWNVYSLIAIVCALIFFAGFVYAKIRYGELSDIEQNALRAEEKKWQERYGEATSTQGRWSVIQGHMHESSPNAWKIAIIEADIFLEEVLNNAGYVGMTIGEKLKSANPASFTTIQDAWNAHKVRNEVAHVGGDFILTKRLATDTLMQYERVFREFGAI